LKIDCAFSSFSAARKRPQALLQRVGSCGAFVTVGQQERAEASQVGINNVGCEREPNRFLDNRRQVVSKAFAIARQCE
jgi:hypothetical protein